MRSIELRLREKYFAIGLTDISEWLARKQINPSRFVYLPTRSEIQSACVLISYRTTKPIYFRTGSAAASSRRWRLCIQPRGALM